MAYKIVYKDEWIKVWSVWIYPYSYPGAHEAYETASKYLQTNGYKSAPAEDKH